MNFDKYLTDITSLLKTLSKKRKIQLYGILFLIILNSVFELASLGAVVPLIGVIIDPEIIFSNIYIRNIFNYLGYTRSSEIILPVTIIFILITLIAGCSKLIILWANTKYAFTIGTEISLSVFKKTINQPYETFLTSASSESISNIISRIDNVIFWIILPWLNLLSYSIVSIFLIFGLLLVDFSIAIVAGTSILTIYYIFLRLSKKNLEKNSKSIIENQAKIVRIIQESHYGIRDLIINNQFVEILSKYELADRLLRKSYASNLFISGSPKFFLETFGIIVIVLIAFFSLELKENISTIIPKLGALALAAQRLLPASQQIYSAWTSIKGASDALAKIASITKTPDVKENISLKKITTKKSLKLHNISYIYPGSTKKSLNKIYLSIKINETYALYGKSGSGKSTLVDLIMGLLPPKKGYISVDGIQLKSKKQILSWQLNISHVPQTIYLFNGDLVKNITLLNDENDIDYKHYSQIIKICELDEFEKKYHKRKVKNLSDENNSLSGGEKQRIGIARALYQNRSFLILDEATNAMDFNLEKKIINNILNFYKEKTIIFITHRISTLKLFKNRIKINNGSII